LAVVVVAGEDRPMRVLVAGSSGLIGTELVATLRRDGHEVTRLVRRTPAGADELQWDPTADRVPEDGLDDADAVVNLCGVGVGDKRWSGSYKQAIRDSRMAPTEVLARAVAARRVGVLVNASAVGYYGDTGSREIDESAPAGEGFLAQVCTDWERATGAADDVARVVHLRTGLVLAAHGGLMGKLRPLYKLALGGRLGSGRQYFPWISLRDEVDAIVHALTHDDVSGPLNLTGPEPVTNAEFNRVLASAYSRPAPWVVPGFALKAVLGEFAEEGVLAGQNAVPRALLDSGFTFTHRTLGQALASLAA
jgi:uncharacterized protein (TIGR01777 family)